MIQKEHALERTLQMTQGEYNNMMQILQCPLNSQLSENFADISNTNSSREELGGGLKSVENDAQARINDKNAETTENIFDSEPMVNEVKKITSNRVSVPDDQDPKHSKSRASAGAVKCTDKSLKDGHPKSHGGGATGPEPEFKEPKLEKPEKHSLEKTQISAAAATTEDPAAEYEPLVCISYQKFSLILVRFIPSWATSETSSIPCFVIPGLSSIETRRLPIAW